MQNNLIKTNFIQNNVIQDNSTNYCPIDGQFNGGFHSLYNTSPSQIFHGPREKPIGQVAGEMIYNVCKVASQYLWGVDNKNEILEMVKADPQNLYWANEQLRNDKDVVKQAVMKDGTALQYASPELQGVDKIVILATNNNIRAWNYAKFEVLARNKDIFISQLVQDSLARFNRALAENRYLRDLVKGWAVLIKGAAQHQAKKEIEQFTQFAIGELKSNLNTSYRSDIVESFCSGLKEIVEKNEELFHQAFCKRSHSVDTVIKNTFDVFKRVLIKNSHQLFQGQNDSFISSFVELRPCGLSLLKDRE